MDKKTIAIIGGGNGAHTMAGDLAIRGYKVRMFEQTQFIGKLSALASTLTIHCTGAVAGDGKIEMLTDDIEKAIDGAKYIAVVTPSFAHATIANMLKGKLKKDQIILIYPGGFGALEFKKALGDECPVIVQTNNLPYDTRLNGPASVFCSGKSPVSIAIFPSEAPRDMLDDVMEISPYERIYQDVLECDLSLVNPSVHSGPCLINIGAIEQQDLRGKFCMYEHFTFGAAKIDVAIDQERKAVGAAFGYKLTPLEDFCKPRSGKDVTWQDIYMTMHGEPSLTPITGPDSIWNRYLTEDCPNGLVPWSELGKVAGITTPVMDGVISVYSVVHERDWRGIGLKTDKLGLDGMTVEQIKKFLKTGKKN
ncbi:MAG: NAD/NADP octopine/nopaline dehydrogenase family protein [Sphaerochaetaceae bacterium]|nr:NAD/NADP octopine/nopaline dehydrogenase family protein [Sphaerochaetaceae bacterium]